ncbi:MAG TPA: dihydroneopterin aldolase [Bacteroidia bacterium]|nr:dihydroneopterin aldolase [Bacteroidia bacterium]
MGIIRLNQIRLYAYHGCLPSEEIMGGEYVVDVSVDVNFSKAAETDSLADTVDYCVVFEAVKAEMLIRSKLIESVAQRILARLRKEYPRVNKFSVSVTKVSPPIAGPVESVTVVMEG